MASLGEMFGSGGSGSFFNLPECHDLTGVSADIVLIGASGCTPYPSVGFYFTTGPQAVREAGQAYGAVFGHLNFDLGGPVLPAGVVALDAGDLAQDPGDAAGNRARILAAVGHVMDAGAVPALIGGDDSLPIPM